MSNEELRNLYIELLAKASTKDLNENAHPSFINIINSLSPDEAILLKILNKIKHIKVSTSKKRIKNRNEAFTIILSIMKNLIKSFLLRTFQHIYKILKV